MKLKYDWADFTAFFCGFVRTGPAGAWAVAATVAWAVAAAVALAVAAEVTAGDEAVVVPAVELLFELPELAIAPPIPTRSNAPTTMPTLRTRWPFFLTGTCGGDWTKGVDCATCWAPGGA
jgi:hypothetical protein